MEEEIAKIETINFYGKEGLYTLKKLNQYIEKNYHQKDVAYPLYFSVVENDYYLIPKEKTISDKEITELEIKNKIIYFFIPQFLDSLVLFENKEELYQQLIDFLKEIKICLPKNDYTLFYEKKIISGFFKKRRKRTS